MAKWQFILCCIALGVLPVFLMLVGYAICAIKFLGFYPTVIPIWVVSLSLGSVTSMLWYKEFKWVIE